MAGPSRAKVHRERDRTLISQLYLKGWHQTKIAEFLELDQSTICRELKKVRTLWEAESTQNYNLRVAEQLHRLAMIEGETWEAWERSQAAKEQTLSEQLAQAASGSDRKTKVQRRTEERVGDHRFLETLIKCHQERSKLLNLYPTSDRESNNATAAGRSIGGGLSGNTVNSIRAEILGVTHYGQPNRAEPNFAESNNANPIDLSTDMVR